MTILEFFQVDNTEHLTAYLHLAATGAWPKGFIPEGTEFTHGWHLILPSNITMYFIISILGIPFLDGVPESVRNSMIASVPDPLDPEDRDGLDGKNPNDKYHTFLVTMSTLLQEGIGSHTKEAVASDIAMHLAYHSALPLDKLVASYKFGLVKEEDGICRCEKCVQEYRDSLESAFQSTIAKAQQPLKS